MKHRIPLSIAAALLALTATACNKQDPKLLEKRLQQEVEIKELNGELALLTEKIKNLPEDVSGQVKAAEEDLEEKNGEVARLEKEIDALTKEKEKLESELDEYKNKYPIN